MQCRYCDEMYHDRWSLMQHQKTHRSGRYRIAVSFCSELKQIITPTALAIFVYYSSNKIAQEDGTEEYIGPEDDDYDDDGMDNMMDQNGGQITFVVSFEKYLFFIKIQ